MRRGTQVTIAAVVLVVVVAVGAQINPEPPADAEEGTDQVALPLPEVFAEDTGIQLGHDLELTAELRADLQRGEDVEIRTWTAHEDLGGHHVWGEVTHPAGFENVVHVNTDRYVSIVVNSGGLDGSPDAAGAYHGYVRQLRELGWEEAGGDGGLRLDRMSPDPGSDLIVIFVMYNAEHSGRPVGFPEPPACEYVEVAIYGQGDRDYPEVTVSLEYHNLSSDSSELPAWAGC